jgi:hypothetical protein
MDSADKSPLVEHRTAFRSGVPNFGLPANRADPSLVASPKPVSGPRDEALQGNRITSALRYTQVMCIRIVSLPAVSRSGKFDANRTPSA